jgi:hypothetical protein
VQGCFDQTTHLLASLAGGSQGSSQSPYPDGAYFLNAFNLAFNDNKIGSNLDLDLDNASIAAASLWEGGQEDIEGEYLILLCF